jgi:uncharacterized protein YciI
LFNAQVQEAIGLSSPAKRYAERMTRALETTQSELVTVRNELAEHRKLLQNRKYHRKGKRLKLKGRFVYSTQEVLAIAQEPEAEASNNKGRRQSRQRSFSLELEVMKIMLLQMCLVIMNRTASLLRPGIINE